MAKVITVSRTFPAYHPKAGQPTYFVEQVLNALGMNKPFNSADFQHDLIVLNTKNIAKGKLTYDHIIRFCASLNMKITSQKLHTIRAKSVNKKTGETYSRWKQGEKASLRVWSGTPYRSPQIIIAPEVELVNVLNFMIHTCRDNINWIDIGSGYFHSSDMPIDQSIVPMVAKNDGLTTEDLLAWFNYPKAFFGQILCWKGVNYE